MKDLNSSFDKRPDIFEDALQKAKGFLLNEKTLDGWISKILGFFISHPSLRNEYNSLMRDLVDNFKYEKISLEHLKRILLCKDSKGFLIPEVTLVNSSTTLYLQGYIEESVNMLSQILDGVKDETAREVAFLLYCLRDEEYTEKIISVCKKIHEEKTGDEESRYDYLQRYASTRGLRSKYFTQVFFQTPKSKILKEIFTEAFEKFSRIRLLILSASIIFSFCWEEISEEEKEMFCRNLENHLEKEEEENVKADILDLLARNFPEKNHQEQIRLLGQKGGAKTFYENTQNIHIEGLDEKIFEFLEKNQTEDCFDDFCQWIRENSNSEQLESLKRIEKDPSLFMKKYTLSAVCSICWEKIKKSEHSEELKKRLLEEMSDMKDTCFTGHITRLINIFSGFEEGLISIPWEAQIRANLVTKVQKYLEKISGEEKDLLIEQLEESSEDKTLVYQMLENLIKELYAEFVGQGYLSPGEFEIYSEKIIESYVS